MKPEKPTDEAPILAQQLDVDEIVVLSRHRYQSRHRSEGGWVRVRGFMERRQRVQPVTVERRVAH